MIRIFQPQIDKPGLEKHVSSKKEKNRKQSKTIQNKRHYSKKGARRNNLTTFKFRKQGQMPTKTFSLNISILLPHNFVKVKSELLIFRSILLFFDELVWVGK